MFDTILDTLLVTQCQQKKIPIPQLTSHSTFTIKYARLIEGDSLWYIIYSQTNPITQKLERKRETFGINRIKDLEERRRVGEEYVEIINLKLPLGYPFESAFKKLPHNTCTDWKV